MELAELLESEGVDPDELTTWARARVELLVAELAEDPEAGPLLELLEPGVEVDVAAVSVALPVREAPVLELHAEEAPELPIDVNADDLPVAITHEPSTPPPLSADELPPPPEPPRLADGEPEPILETFDTRPIDLGLTHDEALAVAEAAAAQLAAEEQSELEQPEQAAEAEDEDAGGDELEEIELDELVEIDAEELEMLEEVDDSEPPPPPPPPPSSGPPPLAAEAEAPVQTGDTASFPIIEEQPPVQTGDTASFPIIEEEPPVQTGDTASHPIVTEDAPKPEPSDDFDLDFDDD